MQQCAPPTFTSEKMERQVSLADNIKGQSISGGNNTRNKRQEDSVGDCDQDDEINEEDEAESSRTHKRRKVSRRELQDNVPHSLSNTTKFVVHTVRKDLQQSTGSTINSTSINQMRSKKLPTRKHPKQSTQIDEIARNINEVNLRVAIPQSTHPNRTGIINFFDKGRLRETIAVTMEKIDRKGDSDAVDEITISVDPLGLEDLFTEEIDTNQDIGVIPISVKGKEPHYLNKTNKKLRSYGRAQNNHTNLKSKVAPFSRTDAASDETPVVESGFHINESNTEQVGVESQKTLSPLTPLSSSEFLQGTGSAETFPEVEVPLSPSAPDDSETITSDDGTQYCISESEDEIDKGVEVGLLKTFAQSVWGMFSAPSSDET